LLYKVEGKVILKENDQASMIKMTALIKGVSESFDVLPLKKVNETFYSFEYFSQPDESIILEPRLQEGSNLLFYPKTKEFTIEDECVLDIKFEAKSGLIITGNVVPPTEGVNIKIKD